MLDSGVWEVGFGQSSPDGVSKKFGIGKHRRNEVRVVYAIFLRTVDVSTSPRVLHCGSSR